MITLIKISIAVMTAAVMMMASAAHASGMPEDGRYIVSVVSSSSMFRIARCELVVADGRAEAVITLGGKGFSHLYAGTAAEAEAAGEGAWAAAREGSRGRAEFTVPISALDVELDLAAMSKKRGTWFDHKITLRSSTLRRADE